MFLNETGRGKNASNIRSVLQNIKDFIISKQRLWHTEHFHTLSQTQYSRKISSVKAWDSFTVQVC